MISRRTSARIWARARSLSEITTRRVELSLRPIDRDDEPVGEHRNVELVLTRHLIDFFFGTLKHIIACGGISKHCEKGGGPAFAPV